MAGDLTVPVKFFARARDLAGEPEVCLQFPEDAIVSDLRRELSARYPNLSPIVRQLLIAIDAQYATDETRLLGCREVACFPPVSGG